MSLTMNKDQLIEAIKMAKEARYIDEMSDDYSYSNGKYDRHTQRINELEAQLESMTKD